MTRWPPSLTASGIGPTTPVRHDPDLRPRERVWVGDVLHVGSEIAEQIRRARG